MERVQQNFLSIESAVRGGSIALFSNGSLVASQVGDGDRSRSEDLLYDITEMLRTSAFDKRDLDAIFVSRGPGSFTGVRIGISTAMGLGDSLGIPVNGVELFDLVNRSVGTPQDSVIVVPIGRNDVAWHHFGGRSSNGEEALDRPQAGTLSEFLQIASTTFGESTLYCHPSIYETLSSISDAKIRITSLNPNLAAAIGNAIIDGFHPADDLKPIYLSNSTLRS